MTLILKQLFGFIKLLNSDTGTNQLAAGIAAGFILGMTPALSLQSLLIFLCFFIFRIQTGAAMLAAFFFSFVAYLLDPVFHAVGSSILELQSLSEAFTYMYNMPIIPLTRFNNSIVMGSGAVAFLLSPFVFILSKQLIVRYRSVVLEKIKQTRVWQALKATALFKWYYTYDNLYK